MRAFGHARPPAGRTASEPQAAARCRRDAGDATRKACASDSLDATERVAIARVRAGDREAYAVLVRLHAAPAHRTARLFGADADVEDVVQLAFVKAYQALPRFRDGAAFRPWLLRIVANEARNAARADRRRSAATQRLAALDVADVGADPVTSTLSRERRSELVAALRELPNDQQRVVACRYLLDLDEAATAAVLGWRRGTVKSRLHRAMARLRIRLADVEPAIREAEHER